MQTFISTILITIFCVFSLVSCDVETKDQVEYRNQNFIWFVPNGETVGRWVEIDYSGNSKILTSGNCTEFYYNGNESIKYNLDRMGKRDTTFYFDLNGIITHYSTYNEENIENYFYLDGNFESFLWDGSMAISGIVQGNQLVEFQLEGKIADVYKLVSSKTNAWRGFEGFLRELSNIVQNSYLSGETKISDNKFEELNSLRLNLIDSTTFILEELVDYEVDKECINLKESSIMFINSTNLLLEEDSKKMLQIMRLEFSDENVNSLANLTRQMLEKSEEADRNDEEINREWSRFFKPGDYLLPYLDNLDR